MAGLAPVDYGGLSEANAIPQSGRFREFPQEMLEPPQAAGHDLSEAAPADISSTLSIGTPAPNANGPLVAPAEFEDPHFSAKPVGADPNVAKLEAEAIEADRELNVKMDPNKANRLAQAKELLGKYYRNSVVREGEQVEGLDKLVHQWTKRALPKKWKQTSEKVAAIILTESQKYKFDPIFLMSVIENESSFNPGASGPFGEVGLMQLRPATARWIMKKYSIRPPVQTQAQNTAQRSQFNKNKLKLAQAKRAQNTLLKGSKQGLANRSLIDPKDQAIVDLLKDPVMNIRIGSAYLAHLREHFDNQGRLYLAAYNMGTRNVHKALGKQITPKIYPARVMVRYVRYYREIKNATHKNSTDEVAQLGAPASAQLSASATALTTD